MRISIHPELQQLALYAGGAAMTTLSEQTAKPAGVGRDTNAP
ncbi:MAG: hypothetical protein WCZ66_11585 [Sphingomonadaceae bacterium]